MDQSWMKALKQARERKVPPDLLKNFESDVEKRIHERGRLSWGLRAGIPAAALALLFLFLVLWRHAPGPMPPSTAPAKLTGAGERSSEESRLIEELELFKALEVWTEEDDLALGVSLENTVAELELATPQLPL
jgi:hypothetical protein